MKPAYLTPAVKGAITGAAIIIFLVWYYYAYPAGTASPAMYLEPVLFAMGIVWAIMAYYKSVAGPVTFGKLFQQGFRCIIVATLIVTLYYFIFYKMHPELVEQNAIATRDYLLKNNKDKTPAEIAQLVNEAKKNFAVMIASATIFQHLIMGAVVSAATAGVLFLQKKK